MNREVVDFPMVQLDPLIGVLNDMGESAWTLSFPVVTSWQSTYASWVAHRDVYFRPGGVELLGQVLQDMLPILRGSVTHIAPKEQMKPIPGENDDRFRPAE